MLTNTEIDDAVIRTYLEIYLAALNDKKSQRYIDTIKTRMQELLSRRSYRDKF